MWVISEPDTARGSASDPVTHRLGLNCILVILVIDSHKALSPRSIRS